MSQPPAECLGAWGQQADGAWQSQELHLSSTSAHRPCPAPTSSRHSSCLPGQLGGRQAGTLLLPSLDGE